MASAFRVVLLTSPRGKQAEILARGLVSARLAACVNIVPGVISHYRWKGRLLKDAECLLIAKTSVKKLPALKRWVAAHHPYEVPEVLALKADDSSKSYLSWLAGELK